GITPQQAEISSGTAAAIRRAHPVRVATLFGFAALGVLTLAYLLVHALGLPDWAFAGAVGLAAAGLPIMLWTGVIERRRALAGNTGRAAVPAGVQRWFTWRRALFGQALGRRGRQPGGPLDLALARELAQREGAKAVVHGQIDPLGRGYVVSAELVSAADGAALVSVRENAPDDGAIIAAVDRLS